MCTLSTFLPFFLLATAAHAVEPLPGDPAATVAAIYEAYRAASKDGAEPHVAGVFSRRLQALLDEDEAATPEGEVGSVDFDVFVDGQDWRITDLEIAPLNTGTGRVVVRATFKNFGEPRNLLYSMVLEDGRWKIDEIEETLAPRWVLSKLLSGSD